MVSEGQIIVISVEAKGEVLEKVEEVRGEIVADPNKVGEMGIYARVKDSEGNVVGVWEDLKGK